MTPASSRLIISLLGPPEVMVDGQALEVDTRKATALLAYLTVTGTSHSRDSLVDLLWPSSGPDRGRSALRRTLSTLKTSLAGRWLKADRFAVSIEGPGIELDLSPPPLEPWHDHAAHEACPKCIEPLTRWTGLHRGRFMDGFYLGDAPEFEAWQTAVDTEHRRHLGRALERLAVAHAAANDWAQAADVARRRVGLDPLDESAHRQLMLGLAWAGDRSGAVEAYRACVGVLDRELGVPPLEETVELADAILAEDLPRMPGMVRMPTRPPRPESHLELIGRERQLERLFGLSRTGGCVSIAGEVGIGKTALIEAFAASAERPVATARGLQSETTVPYGVVSQLIRARSLEGIDGWVVRELSRLLPEMGENFEHDQIDPLAAERRLHDAVVTGLNWVAATGPLLIDDVQWVDASSSMAIAAVAARAIEQNIMVCLSGRWEEVPVDSPLMTAASERIELSPLEPEDAAMLARHAEVDFSDLDDLMKRTGGVPLYLVTPVDGPGAERLRASILNRLERLDGLSRQVLTAAAIEEGPVHLDWLRRVSGRSEEEIVEALDRLARASFLRERPATVSFAHDVQRMAVYESTSLARRRLLHRRAAGETPEGDVKSLVAAARHARLAGDDEMAADLLLRAGDLARPAFDLAAESYREALGLGHPDRRGIHRRLGEIAMLRGDYRSALRDFEAAATAGGFDPVIEHLIGDVYRRLGRWEQAERQFELARAEHPSPALLLADWALMADRLGDSKAALALASESVERAESDEEAARALNVIGLLTPNPAEARNHLESSLRRAGGNPVLRLATLHSLSLAVEKAGDLAGAIRLAEDAMNVAVDIGDRHRQAAILSRLADLHHAITDEAKSREYLTESVALFAELGDGTDDIEPEVWMLTRW